MRKAIQWTRGERIVRWFMFGGVIALAVLTLWFSLRKENGPPELKAGSDVSLPLVRLKPGKLFLFRYHIDPYVTTQVAVQKGSDGIIRAALASCSACATSQNYEWSGRLICGRCRNAMKMPDPAVEPRERSEGCDLASLAYAIVGATLVVRGEAIEAEYSRQFKRGNTGQPSR